jgi:hypothetical protein
LKCAVDGITEKNELAFQHRLPVVYRCVEGVYHAAISALKAKQPG